MAKIEITAVVKVIADVPDNILNNKTTVQDVHDVAHGIFANSMFTMPCPAYKPAVLVDGKWMVQVEASLEIDAQGGVELEVPQGELAASGAANAAHMH